MHKGQQFALEPTTLLVLGHAPRAARYIIQIILNTSNLRLELVHFLIEIIVILVPCGSLVKSLGRVLELTLHISEIGTRTFLSKPNAAPVNVPRGALVALDISVIVSVDSAVFTISWSSVVE
jgi:hypothetical protein